MSDFVEKLNWKLLISLNPTVPARITDMAEDYFLDISRDLDDAVHKVDVAIRNVQSAGWDISRRSGAVTIAEHHYKDLIKFYELSNRDVGAFENLSNCEPSVLYKAIRKLKEEQSNGTISK